MFVKIWEAHLRGYFVWIDPNFAKPRWARRVGNDKKLSTLRVDK